MDYDCTRLYFSNYIIVYLAFPQWFSEILIILGVNKNDTTKGEEIGVYSTDKDDLDIYDVFSGTFYNCVNNQDLLQISFVLKKNDEILFTREDKHWWLTGFKLGEFCNPSELKMKLSITLKDRGMRNAFIKGLKEAGYSEEKLSINDNTVSLEFNEPRTTQPLTRKAKTDWIIQKKNKLLCDKYQEITGSYDNFPDKMKAVQKEAPELFEAILKIGKTKDIFEKYKEIKDYLD